MVFAWQGFLLEHPIDWAPLSLTGIKKEGYARISSLDRGFLQLRWKEGSSDVSELAVNRYLGKLADHAKRSRVAYHDKVVRAGSRIRYSYRSDISARGVLFPYENSSGVVFLEAVDTSQSTLQKAEASFQFQEGLLERWCLHGLDVLIPRLLKLDSHELKAGKTVLQFSGSKMRLVAERWGFAEMLLETRSLANWVQALSGLERAESESKLSKVSLHQKRGILPDIWLKAVHQEDLNQITLIRVESRKSEYQPQWNWFAP